MTNDPAQRLKLVESQLTKGHRGQFVDAGGGGGDDGGMLKRLTVLETRWETVIPTLATKGDLSEMTLRILVAMVAIAALCLAGLTFVINRVVPPAQSQPIVIQLPAPPAVSKAASGP